MQKLSLSRMPSSRPFTIVESPKSPASPYSPSDPGIKLKSVIPKDNKEKLRVTVSEPVPTSKVALPKNTSATPRTPGTPLPKSTTPAKSQLQVPPNPSTARSTPASPLPTSTHPVKPQPQVHPSPVQSAPDRKYSLGVNVTASTPLQPLSASATMLYSPIVISNPSLATLPASQITSNEQTFISNAMQRFIKDKDFAGKEALEFRAELIKLAKGKDGKEDNYAEPDHTIIRSSEERFIQIRKAITINSQYISHEELTHTWTRNSIFNNFSSPPHMEHIKYFEERNATGIIFRFARETASGDGTTYIDITRKLSKPK